VLRIEGVWDGEEWVDRMLATELDSDRTDAAKKKGKIRAQPKCTKGRPCGGTCIRKKTATGKDTQCHIKPDGPVKEALTRAAKAATPKAPGQAGGGGAGAVGAANPQTWQDFVKLGSKVFSKELAAIDKSLSVPESIRAELASLGKEYQSLIDKKGKSAAELGRLAQIDSKIMALTQKDNENEYNDKLVALRDKLVSRGNLSTALRESGKVKIPPGLPFSDQLNYRSEVTKLYQASGNSVSTLKELGYFTDRASTHEDGWINVGKSGGIQSQTAALWHEFGHHIEFSNSRAGLAAQSFIKDRSTGDPQPMSVLNAMGKYRDDEIAYPGKFVSPYVGKIYRGSPPSTEVISVGLEMIAFPQTLNVLYKKDREHLLFVLGVLAAGRPNDSI
jgi:hypothetical protein